GALLDTVREYRAKEAAESLKVSVALKEQVLRDGQEVTVLGQDLVPRDVVLLAAGDLAPTCRRPNVSCSDSISARRWRRRRQDETPTRLARENALQIGTSRRKRRTARATGGGGGNASRDSQRRGGCAHDRERRWAAGLHPPRPRRRGEPDSGRNASAGQRCGDNRRWRNAHHLSKRCR